MVNASGNQGGSAQTVDLAGNAAGVFEDALEGIVAERGTGGIPGNAQMALDVLNGFFMPPSTGSGCLLRQAQLRMAGGNCS